MEEVALAEEKLVSHPFLNAYNAFLVKDPTISSWSLARLKTPSITANNQDRNPNAKNERRVCLLSLIPSDLTSANPLWHRAITYSTGWVTIEGQVKDGDTATGFSGLLKVVSRRWATGQEPDILPLYDAKRRDRDDGIRGRCRRTEEVVGDRSHKGLASRLKNHMQRYRKPEAEWRELYDEAYFVVPSIGVSLPVSYNMLYALEHLCVGSNNAKLEYGPFTC
ncbi:hypothetical protein ARMGADRAFT_1036340 [Armillaria gallica]|uniref:Uncharacterized protein n=1 Tax=Armillaria gallica TaxID=47427 RepID=A0A2H3CUU5_ARMGA|nr:hypothetical protein ARMGADRAFT_1036340 [Armillaria gallica]